MATPTQIDYALLAGASYYDTRSELNRFPLPQNWSVLSRIPENSTSGFEASAFQNGNEIVISYAGTNSNPNNDFLTELLTNPDKQADAAL